MNYERLPMYAFSNSPASARLRSSATTRFQLPFSFSFPATNARSARSHSPSKKHRYNPRIRTIINFLKFAVPATVLFLFLGLYLYEPHVELSFYNRNWIYKEIETLGPLSGCFNRVSSLYNVSEAVYGMKKTIVQAGMPLRMGLDCYDLAGTIPRPEHGDFSVTQHIPGDQRMQYHTYWRHDLAPFGPRQDYMLKSFFATQNTKASRLVLWSNGDLSGNAILGKYARENPDAFALKIVDKHELAKGTLLEGNAMLDVKDTKAWVDGDLIRLLLLWNYGGVWVDMDTLLTRDLEPLFEHEFVTQWDCYDKPYAPLNGALMRFRKHSPYLCEAFHIIFTSPFPREGSTDWGSLLYFKLWRRLVAGGIPPFQILPFCFSDARSCRLDNRLPDPFSPDNAKGKWTMGLGMEEGGGLDKVLGKVFGVHLHNQWEKDFPKDGWVERLLLNRYEKTLETT